MLTKGADLGVKALYFVVATLGVALLAFFFGQTEFSRQHALDPFATVFDMEETGQEADGHATITLKPADSDTSQAAQIQIPLVHFSFRRRSLFRAHVFYERRLRCCGRDHDPAAVLWDQLFQPG